MKNSKTSIQPDGSVWYKHYTVESSRPKKDGGSFFSSKLKVPQRTILIRDMVVRDIIRLG